MIRISLKALTKMLLKHGHRFQIEPNQHYHFRGRNIFNFIVGKDYPAEPYVYIAKDSEDRGICMEEKRAHNPGKIFMQYDCDRDEVLSCAVNMYTTLKSERSKALERMFQSTT